MIRNIILFLIMSILAKKALTQSLAAVEDGQYKYDSLYEKMYVHTDKEFYMPGEILWFKVYVVDGRTMEPLGLNSVAYIDLLNDENKSVLQAKIDLGKTVRNGSLYIPNQLPSGIYRMVGYTNSMKNYGDETLFLKAIEIVNPYISGENLLSENLAVKNALQLFPESGILLDNIASRLAYKLSGINSNERFEIVVLEGDGTEVYREVSNAQGMGSLPILPKSDKKYKVRAILSDKSIVEAQFPKIYDNGYLFNVIRDDQGGWNIAISASKQHIGEAIRLSAKNRYQSAHSVGLILNGEGKASTHIAYESLPVGVNVLTLTDEMGEPLAERLLFKYPDNELDIVTKLDAEMADKRSLINMDLQSLVNGQQVESDLSVSVYKVDALQNLPRQNIHSYLWLQSEVKGYIENSAYYFSDKENEQVQRDLDVLLLTQGWRRITSRATDKEKFLTEIAYHHVRIRYTDRDSRRPFTGENVFLSVLGKTPKIYTATTDSAGIATFLAKNIFGESQMATQLAGNKESNIELLSSFITDYELNKQQLFFRGYLDLKDALLNHSINVQAENAFHQARRAQFLSARLDNFPFYGKADVRYQLDDYTRFVVMEEVLREYVKEVNVRRSNSRYGLRVFDGPRGYYLSNDPLILLDGVPILDADEIMRYDPLKVKSIDVVTGRYVYGPFIYDGIVTFNTYEGLLKGFALNPTVTLIDYEGLQREREFYVPTYETPEQRQSRLPDRRNVLFWEPNITMDSSGKVSLTITTSDLKGDYVIVIEGMDKQGHIGSAIKNIVVE
ncbi:hypothetical protein [Olivibacter sitiensis]|uniref:hypothetical protein n=1 Tax=Olivibacter sitiensis TaxID=376470 RepID=UPI0012FB6739|nr:hypothetical protein [Olivibacter sitiensis]